VLTASGGPFRGRSRAEMAQVTPAEALRHPNFSMGTVVTTNSATMVNKGLEVIEAHHLFDIPLQRIEVVVHPQQQIHSMVEFHDGSTIAQAGPPRMLVPIALGLSWPGRLPDVDAPCDWTQAATWQFEPLDEDAFPAVRLARRAGQTGGTFPAVYNAANEECVAAFHQGSLPFLAITDVIAQVLDDHATTTGDPVRRDGSELDVAAVLAADAWARRRAQQILSSTPETGNDMDFFLGVLILAVGLILSIALHELGHLIPAKLFKVKVSQYFVGFGKTLWSTTRRGTEYGVKMLPLGGYVRMIGMFPPGKSGEDSHAEQSEDARQEERARRTGLRGMAATIVDDTRAASGSDIEEEIHPGDGTKPFYQLTMPR